MLLLRDLLTFPTLSDICSFSGLLTKGQGEFPSIQLYNLGMGKVGKGGRGRNEGYGKWVELADLPTLHKYFRAALLK